MIVAVLALLLSGSLLAALVDRDHYVARAAEAIDSYALVERAWFPFAPTTAPYRYHHADCLVLSMLTQPPAATLMRSALSPRYPETLVPKHWLPGGVDAWRQTPASRDRLMKAPQHNECYRFRADMAGRDVNRVHYHRYINGSWVVAALLLLPMSFQSATALLFLLALAPAGILVVVASRRLWGSAGSARDAAFLTCGIAYLLASGVTLFGWSLALAPGEIILSGFLLFAFLKPLNSLAPGTLVLAAATFGCLTAAFEYLSGGIPAGVALLLGLMGMDQLGRVTFSRAAMAVGAFCFAILATFALKAGAVALVWSGEEITAAGARLTVWTTPGGWSLNPSAADRLAAFGISADDVQGSRLAATAFALIKLAYFSDLLTLGSRPLGWIVCVGGPLALIALAARDGLRGKDPQTRLRALLLLGSALALIVWYAFLVRHTIEHAYFVQRPLAWLFLIAVGSLAWRLSARRTARHRVHASA
jgi:hypothetical protein